MVQNRVGRLMDTKLRRDIRVWLALAEDIMARLGGGMKGIRIGLSRMVDIMVWLGVVLGIRIRVVDVMAGYVRVMLEGVVVGSRIRVVDVIAGGIMVSLEGLVGSRTMEVVMARLDGGMKGIRIRLGRMVDIMVWLGVVLGI